MQWIMLVVILTWTVFWLGYALYCYNSERLYYRPRKVFTKKERPFLFHAEIAISVMWALLGFAMLYIFLQQSI